MTYAAYDMPVAATLLDESTGASLLPLSWPVRTIYRDGVIQPEDLAPVDRRDGRKAAHSNGRRVEITCDPADAGAFALALAAIDASKGGAGIIEWRHPDDDPEDDPTLWRFIGDEFAAPRPVPHQTTITLTLEEIA